MTSSAFFLEILNGGSIAPELIWMTMLGVYLSRESQRRGLRWFDWFRLPPSMNLILAVFICDAGVCLRSIIVWGWRRDGAGEFNEMEVAGLIVGSALIFCGYLCKIRAWTHPDYGDWPWVVACIVSAIMVVVLIKF